MKQASVGTSSDFVDDIGLEIAVDGSWDIFAIACASRSEVARSRVQRLTCLGEEGAEALISICGLAFLGKITIWLPPVSAC